MPFQSGWLLLAQGAISQSSLVKGRHCCARVAMTSLLEEEEDEGPPSTTQLSQVPHCCVPPRLSPGLLASLPSCGGHRAAAVSQAEALQPAKGPGPSLTNLCAMTSMGALAEMTTAVASTKPIPGVTGTKGTSK